MEGPLLTPHGQGCEGKPGGGGSTSPNSPTGFRGLILRTWGVQWDSVGKYLGPFFGTMARWQRRPSLGRVGAGTLPLRPHAPHSPQALTIAHFIGGRIEASIPFCIGGRKKEPGTTTNEVCCERVCVGWEVGAE